MKMTDLDKLLAELPEIISDLRSLALDAGRPSDEDALLAIADKLEAALTVQNETPLTAETGNSAAESAPIVDSDDDGEIVEHQGMQVRLTR
jgi:hypothetical protein